MIPLPTTCADSLKTRRTHRKPTHRKIDKKKQGLWTQYTVGVAKGHISLMPLVTRRQLYQLLNALCFVSLFLTPPPLPLLLPILHHKQPKPPCPPCSRVERKISSLISYLLHIHICILMYKFIYTHIHMNIHKYMDLSKYMCINLY